MSVYRRPFDYRAPRRAWIGTVVAPPPPMTDRPPPVYYSARPVIRRPLPDPILATRPEGRTVRELARAREVLEEAARNEVQRGERVLVGVES